jgi:hypothetical protein
VSRPSLTFKDEQGNDLAVGTAVIYGGVPEQEAWITELFDPKRDYPDIDFDDALGRPRESPPEVTIRFGDGSFEKCLTYNVTPLSWADYPDGPDTLIYEVPDLERKP